MLPQDLLEIVLEPTAHESKTQVAMEIDLACYPVPPVWSDLALLHTFLESAPPEVIGWTLLASAARCDSVSVQQTILPFSTTNDLFAVEGTKRCSYIGMLIGSLIDSCDQLGTSSDDPELAVNQFPVLIKNALKAGFRPLESEVKIVERFKFLEVSNLFKTFATKTSTP